MCVSFSTAIIFDSSLQLMRLHLRGLIHAETAGAFDLHVGWLSISCSLDRVSVEAHHIMWRNPPSFTATPFLAHIKVFVLRLVFSFVSSCDLFRTSVFRSIHGLYMALAA